MFSSRTTTFTELTYRAKGNEEQQAACIMQLSNKKNFTHTKLHYNTNLVLNMFPLIDLTQTLSF